jgi:tetratricopeptide (TPR) repeat protein
VATFDFCPNCGSAMAAGKCPQCAEQRIVHRDVLLLVLVSLLATGIFLFTRAMAAKERELDARVAAYWFRAGEGQLRNRELEKAVESFRKATSRDRDNQGYVLALANALSDAGHHREARQALLRLRESAPENAEINLYLARVAVKTGDADEAVRYYHNALYGLWTGMQVDQERRKVRVELIHYLLGRGERSRALSELLALASESPQDSAAAQIETGQLFLQAGDAQHALRHFSRALNLEPKNAAALFGAGDAFFQLGNFAQAHHDLESALAVKPDAEPARHLLALTKMILANDPLAPHLTREERNRRVRIAYGQALSRLQSCAAKPSSASGDAAALAALQSQAESLKPALAPEKLRRDPELLRSAMELISKIEEATSLRCGEPEGLDRALLLIARKHRGVLQ